MENIILKAILDEIKNQNSLNGELWNADGYCQLIEQSRLNSAKHTLT